jgi:hypothetical protein
MIYTVDAHGKMDRGFAPFIEGTLKGPEAVFGLLAYHLRQLNVGASDKILFIADGARWICNRVSGLIKSLGLARINIYELVDFYHAVEHLSKVADLKKNWRKSEKRCWLKKHRRLLLKGHADKVINAIRLICRGRNSKGFLLNAATSFATSTTCAIERFLTIAFQSEAVPWKAGSEEW